MRTLLVLLTILFTSTSLAAPPTKKAKTDVSLTEESVRFATLLKKAIEEQGYQNIQLAPQLFVLFAEKNGQHVGLIVNVQEMTAMEVEKGDGLQELAGQMSETRLPGMH